VVLIAGYGMETIVGTRVSDVPTERVISIVTVPVAVSSLFL